MSIDLDEYWVEEKLVARAMALSANHDYSSAIADYTQAISVNPSNFRLYIQRGYLRNITGDLHGKKTDDLLAAQLKDKCNDTEVC